MGILKRSKGKARRKRFLAWQVEITTRCYSHCPVCIKAAYSNLHQKDMDIDDFKAIAPYFHDVEHVVLEGWGEPLLHPKLLDFIERAKAEGALTGFVTSGAGLDAAYIVELCSVGIDFIGFSFAGATAKTHNAIRPSADFDSLISSIELFGRTASEGGPRSPKLHLVYLMLQSNVDEVPLLIELAKKLKMEEMVLINIIQVTNAWQDSQRVFTCGGTSPYEKILKEAKERAKHLNIRIHLPSLSPEEVAVCADNPLRNIYVSVEGEVSPCVFLHPPVPSPFRRIFCGKETRMEKVSFGNLFKEPFGTIWNKAEYGEFRDCFTKRRKRIEEIYSSLFTMEPPREVLLPPLPPPCRTCHKILGL